MKAPKIEVLGELSKITKRPDLSKLTAAEIQKVLDQTPDLDAKLAEKNITRDQINDQLNSMQKGFWSKYLVDIQSPNEWFGGVPVLSHLGAIVGSTVSTAWNAATLRPIEGFFTERGWPVVGKIARWAAVAATAYGLWHLFAAGAGDAGAAAGNAVGDSVSSQVSGTGTLAPVESTGAYATTPIQAPPVPAGADAALNMTPPPPSPGTVNPTTIINLRNP